MELEKDTCLEKADHMPRLKIFEDPNRGTSHATDVLHIKFDVGQTLGRLVGCLSDRFQLFFDLWFVASLQVLAEVMSCSITICHSLVLA